MNPNISRPLQNTTLNLVSMSFGRGVLLFALFVGGLLSSSFAFANPSSPWGQSTFFLREQRVPRSQLVVPVRISMQRLRALVEKEVPRRFQTPLTRQGELKVGVDLRRVGSVGLDAVPPNHLQVAMQLAGSVKVCKKVLLVWVCKKAHLHTSLFLRTRFQMKSNYQLQTKSHFHAVHFHRASTMFLFRISLKGFATTLFLRYSKQAAQQIDQKWTALVREQKLRQKFTALWKQTHQPIPLQRFLRGNAQQMARGTQLWLGIRPLALWVSPLRLQARWVGVDVGLETELQLREKPQRFGLVPPLPNLQKKPMKPGIQLAASILLDWKTLARLATNALQQKKIQVPGRSEGVEVKSISFVWRQGRLEAKVFLTGVSGVQAAKLLFLPQYQAQTKSFSFAQVETMLFVDASFGGLKRFLLERFVAAKLASQTFSIEALAKTSMARMNALFRRVVLGKALLQGQVRSFSILRFRPSSRGLLLDVLIAGQVRVLL